MNTSLRITAAALGALTAVGLGVGAAEARTVNGTPGADVIETGRTDDVLRGFGSGDVLGAGGGRDRLLGGRGNDGLFGQRGPDRLYGGPGADALTGGPGRDRLYGGRGTDLLDGRDGVRDVLDCGAGVDLVHVDQYDVVRNCEHVISQ